MSFDDHANFAISTVATAPSPATTGPSLVVQSGDGAKFPATPFNATVWPAGTQPTDANAEIVRVTAITTDTLTITRAQEGSTARAIGVGDQIANTATAKVFTDIEDAITAGDRPDWSYVVAASDTPVDLQARADAVCDGTADQAEINTAISTAAALSVGARILLLPGTYYLSGVIDFSPLAVSGSVEDGKWVDFDATAATIKAAANMATMVNLAAPTGKQIFSKLNLKIGRIDGNNGSFTVTQGIYMQRFVDNKVWIGELTHCSGDGIVVDQQGVTDHGCFNNIIEIDKLNVNGGVGLLVTSDPTTTSIYGFQCNTIRCGQVNGNQNGLIIGSASGGENAKLNRFEIGTVEAHTASGIIDKSGQNIWIVGTTVGNTTYGISTVSGITQKSTFIVGSADDAIDSLVISQHFLLNAGDLTGLVEFVAQSSPPGTPVAGRGRLYEKSSTKKLYFKDDAGTEYDLTANPVSSVFGRTGAVVAADADYYGIVAAALTGATQAARFVGATTSGAPASGTFLKGDFVVAQNGHIFVCTVAGTPGTWVDVGGGGGSGVSSLDSITGGVTLVAGSNVTITDNSPSAGEITIAAAGGGTGPAFTTSSTPPASPANGDYWIFPADDTNGVYWMFQYDSSETTYKWRFVGGPPLIVASSPNAVINTLTQVGATGYYYSGNNISLPRDGDYQIGGAAILWTNGAAASAAEAQPFAGTALKALGWQNPTSSTGFSTIPAPAQKVTGITAATAVGIAVHVDSNIGTQKAIQLETILTPIRVS